MNRKMIASMLTATALAIGATGCAVTRHQETTGAYVDDAVVTTRVKSKFATDKEVSAMAIQVETLKGVVQLSGFAKSSNEKMKAEEIARSVNGVVDVKNDIIVRA